MLLQLVTSWLSLELTFSSKLDWGCYIISIAKTASKKIGALIHSMKFLSPEAALYLHKSTIQPYSLMLSHLAGAPSCYLELLNKLKKLICRTASPSLPTSLEPLAHCQNVASLSLFLFKSFLFMKLLSYVLKFCLVDCHPNKFFMFLC